MIEVAGIVKQGWWWPVNSQRAHYFKADSRSLCGKWLALGGDRDDANDASPDNCATCKKRVDKHRLAVRSALAKENDRGE